MENIYEKYLARKKYQPCELQRLKVIDVKDGERVSAFQYKYLDEKDSELYDAVKNSTDPKDMVIRMFLENKADRAKNQIPD